MARPKAADKARSTVAEPATAPNTAEGISKGMAIRLALQQLGKTASREDLIGYVLQKFGHEVSPAYIYLVKSKLKMTRRRKKAAVGHRPNGDTGTELARRGRPSQGACSMSVLRQIKELSQQAGGIKKLKRLVDLLAD
jgi:hypothetical protein